MEPIKTMDYCSVPFLDGMPTALRLDSTLPLGYTEKQRKSGNLRCKKESYTYSTFSVQENKTVVDAVFRKQKFACLSKIDLSKKGSIDEAVADVVVFINHLDQYFTTSSCSGRIYIYEEVYHC